MDKFSARLSNFITVRNPTQDFINWCEQELVLTNPEFLKRQRLGKYTGNVPRNISLYSNLGNIEYYLPYGCLKDVASFKPIMTADFKNNPVDFKGIEVPLYDYQEEAVKHMLNCRYGILQSKAGSGKTQMGIALAQRLGRRTLWLTHTLDLLKQSRQRAEKYIDNSLIGTIAEGKVNLGEAITFATVQTMSKMDLTMYKDMFDTIIVDECHRCCGTANDVTMFGKVLGSLSAQYKFGLSATVHRADGLIKGCYALLGEIKYIVPDEAIADKVMNVEVDCVYTGLPISRDFTDSDGTLNWNKLITYLTTNDERNKLIVDLLEDKPTLILSNRTQHLETLISMMPSDLKEKAVYINGKMTSKKAKEERAMAIEQMRNGEKKYLFATYQLAKEGLDIPRLERLIMATPETDYAVIVQSVGRIARKFEGKENPVVKDLVDCKILTLLKKYKVRKRTYKKEGIKVNE